MEQENNNKTKKQKKAMPDKEIDLNEIVERKKLQSKVLKKMIDSINKNTNNNLNSNQKQF